eukprot:gene10916-2990_t
MAETAFIIRSKSGIEVWDGPPGELKKAATIDTRTSQVSVLSKDGNKLAWSNGEEVVVFNLQSGQHECVIQESKVRDLYISPKGSYLATWKIFTTKDGKASKNCSIWSLPSGEEILAYTQKARTSWMPKWTDDEKTCLRRTPKTLLFFEGSNPGGDPTHKLPLDGLQSFEVAPNLSHCRVAVWVKGTKGQPSAVRVYTPANLGTPLAFKSFFKADTVDIKWSANGVELLVSTQTDSDATGASYYGETSLYFITCYDGTSSNVVLDKKGPLAAVEWSPNGKQFVALYGSMPNKATVFNYKCKQVKDLGLGHRSMARYNPHGTVLAIAGFGNLSTIYFGYLIQEIYSGEVEIWATDKWEMINKFVAFTTTSFEWCPDSRHILMATTAPRLTIDNRFKVWHYTKGQLCCHDYNELYEAVWRPMDRKLFPKRPLSPVPQEAKLAVKTDGGKPEPYRPPAMRGLPTVTLQGSKQTNGDKKKDNKNKKKRQAAKDKTEKERNDSTMPSPPEPGMNKLKDSAKEPEQSEEAVAKRIRAIKKKLRQIDDLEKEKDSGKSLSEAQETKLQTADALRKELESLT